MRFIHCADLHIDSPLRGLAQYEGAPVQEMRDATRNSFDNVVALAQERDVNFVLIAGDIFDGDWQDFNTGLYFEKKLRELRDAGIKVFLVKGNHDAQSKITKPITTRGSAHAFNANKPETVIDEALGVAIHGQSFLNAAVTEDLAANYPAAIPGLINIGLLHTALAGREGHESYAPTTAERLLDKGYHYWALGHVHNREVVKREPWIVFPGNIQGRHAKETGAKGCMVVEYDETGIASADFVATDIARWEHLVIDLSQASSMDDVESTVQNSVRQAMADADGRLMALRISMIGRTSLHAKLVSDPDHLRAGVCAWLDQASSGTAWLEKLKLLVGASIDHAALAARDDPYGWLIRRLNELEARPEALQAIANTALADIAAKIPPELRTDDGIDPASPAFLKEALTAAKEKLLAGIAAEDAQ